jgi:hypothetical protein
LGKWGEGDDWMHIGDGGICNDDEGKMRKMKEEYEEKEEGRRMKMKEKNREAGSKELEEEANVHNALQSTIHQKVFIKNQEILGFVANFQEQRRNGRMKEGGQPDR